MNITGQHCHIIRKVSVFINICIDTLDAFLHFYMV